MLFGRGKKTFFHYNFLKTIGDGFLVISKFDHKEKTFTLSYGKFKAYINIY